MAIDDAPLSRRSAVPTPYRDASNQLGAGYFFFFVCFHIHIYRELLLRGAIVNRTYGIDKNPYVYLILLTIFGPIYYGLNIEQSERGGSRMASVLFYRAKRMGGGVRYWYTAINHDSIHRKEHIIPLKSFCDMQF